MLLAVHLVAASLTLIYVAFLLWHPSQSKFHIAYILVAATIISGSILVYFKRPEHLAGVCTDGLVYLTFMSVAIIAARVKFKKNALEIPSV